MDANIIELIGYLAAFLTTISFIPQVWQVWKTKSVKDISLLMYSLFFIGILLWFTYGVCIGNWPIICANAITGTLAAIVLVFKIKYG